MPRRALVSRMGIGVGALCLLLSSLVLSPGAYLGASAALVLCTTALVGLVFQLQMPILGFALLVATAVAFPLEFRGPAGVMMSSSLPLGVFLCGAWLIRLVLFREAVRIDRSRVVYASITFMAIVALAFAMGQFPWFPTDGAPIPAQIVELALFLVSVCLFLAVGHQLTGVRQLRALTWLMVAAGVVTAVVQTAGAYVPALVFVGRLTTRPGSVGSLFWTWLVALSFSQAVLNRALSPIARLALASVTVLVLYHGLVDVRSWASGWVPPVIVVGTILLIRLPRFSIGLALLAVPLGLFFADTASTALLGDEQYSLVTRQEAWRVLWSLVERSPLLGTGPANYYYYTENLPIMGWYVRFISHNNYQDLLVQTGFLGLLGFCWLGGEMLALTVGVYRRAGDAFTRAYAAGAFAGISGSLASGMLGDWIIPFYYNAGVLGFRSSLLFWVFGGCVLALKRIAAMSAAEERARVSWPIGREDRRFVHAY